MANWYVSSAKYSSVSVWTTLTSYSVGNIVRQTSPSAGNERCFRCSTAGVSGATEPSWGTGKNSTASDGTAVWTECSGQALYNGDGGGSAWAAPHKNLTNMFGTTPTAFASSGDTVYVDKNHNSSVSGALVFGGSLTNFMKILCVDDAVVPPTTLSTGAIESSASSAINIGNASNEMYCYIYGITLELSGSNSQNITHGISTAVNRHVKYDTCTFKLSTTSTSARIKLGSPQYISAGIISAVNEYINCSYIFGSTSQKMTLEGGIINFEGGSIAGTGSVPATIFSQLDIPGQSRAIVNMKDMDLANLNTTLMTYGFSAFSGNIFSIDVQNCKTHASLALTSGTNPAPRAGIINVENCDSSGTNYKFTASDYAGVASQETTTILTGGFYNGVTGSSCKAVTNASAKRDTPLQAFICEQWNENTGSSKTVTIEFCGSTALYNDEIWMEVEYFGDTGSPKGSISSTRISPVGTRSTYSTSSVTWGGSPATKQYMQVSVAPQLKGVIRAKVFVAKASATVYIDPRITVA